MRVHINHTLIMVFTNFFKGSFHLSSRKSDFETLIYIYSDVMCCFTVFRHIQLFAAIKSAPHHRTFRVSRDVSSLKSHFVFLQQSAVSILLFICLVNILQLCRALFEAFLYRWLSPPDLTKSLPILLILVSWG